MHDQVNKHVYLADMREKYFNEVSQLFSIVIKRVGIPKLLQKEINKFSEL
jgi:hypothetical protein